MMSYSFLLVVSVQYSEIFSHVFLHKIHCYVVCIEELECSSVKFCLFTAARSLNHCFCLKLCRNLLNLLKVKSALKGYHLLNLKRQVGWQPRDMKHTTCMCYLKVKS